MPKYRIVKMKHTQYSYKVQEKGWFFWYDTFWKHESMESCEYFIERQLAGEIVKRNNRRDIVVKTY